jgi:hypothetical protein
MLTLIVGITLLVTSCGPTYVRSGYGYNNGYGNNRPSYGYGYPRPYRYSAPVVIVPRYCTPPRRNYGGGYGGGHGYGRGRRG